MIEAAPDRLTLQNMKKGPNEDYKEYAIRWKNVASMVRPSLTSREENFIFVDTLPSPYYDMLIVNTFVEFRDLMYSVGRIEDGIKRGRIIVIGESMREKKRLFPISIFKQCLEREEAKEGHIWYKMSPSQIFLIHHLIPMSPGQFFFTLEVRTKT